MRRACLKFNKIWDGEGKYLWENANVMCSHSRNVSMFLKHSISPKDGLDLGAIFGKLVNAWRSLGAEDTSKLSWRLYFQAQRASIYRQIRNTRYTRYIDF